VLVLGIETSTPQASVALGTEQGVVGSCLISRGSTSGEFVLQAIQFLMSQTGIEYRNLGALAVGIGPGLFTGMRVGLATAKTLAQALSLPIVGVASLDLLAYDARYTPKLICPVIDAKRSEVCFGFYRHVPGGVTRSSEFMVGSPSKLLSELDGRPEEKLLLGSGALLYRKQLETGEAVEFGSVSNSFPRATSLVELSIPRLLREEYSRVFDIEPLYMRRSDAELNWDRAKRK
jgi:tRNA threonylcarbamoyladenosine biosynthesis protein TsaB